MKHIEPDGVVMAFEVGRLARVGHIDLEPARNSQRLSFASANDGDH